VRRTLATAGLLLLIGSAQGQPVSAVDGRGRRIALPAPPRRIVSLGPSLTEILFALGLGRRLVGVTSQCTYPPEARRLPTVGDHRTSIERVVALRPDLVVAGTTLNSLAIRQLERLRIPVFAVDPASLEETHQAILAIGAVTGARTRARAVVAEMRAQEQRVAARVARARGRPRVLVVLQAEPLWVAGAGNFMDELVVLAGGENVGRAAGRRYQALSPERVVALRPEVILAPPSDVDALRRRPGWTGVPAVRQGRVLAFPADTFARPGPRLPHALEQVARLLHPAVFGEAR